LNGIKRLNKVKGERALSEHLTAGQIEATNKRSAPPAELLASLDHLAACESCRERFDYRNKIHMAFETLREDLRRQPYNHLSFEELAGYVDDSLTQADREIVDSHIDLCSSCAAEAADLRAFKAEMTTYPEIERSPARTLTLRERLLSLWRVSAYRIPVLLATAATVALLCVSITLLMRKDSAGLQTEVSELRQSEEAPQVQGASAPPVDAQKPQTSGQNASTQVADSVRDGGGVVALDTEGNVTGLESLPPAYQQEVKAALTNRRVNTPSELQGLIGRTGVLMGAGGARPGFSLVGPVGTVVRADKPDFRWHPLAGATSYVIAVFDSNFNKVLSSHPQTGTEWSPASSLKRGELYSWQVTAIKDGKEIVSPAPPAPDAKFKILDASKSREFEQAKRTHAHSHLVLGILYERAGLLDDAEREFNALYRANPNSVIARKLLRDAKSLRRKDRDK
jgi:predicted anti-sigma-YlaC factor YlaD